MTVMLNRRAHVSWRRFFRRLSAQDQRDLEQALVEGGLLLGEYMELVERAYLEAYALRETSLGRERADLDTAAFTIANKLIGGYVRRKRLFVLLNALAGARLAGALPRETCPADFPQSGRGLRIALSPSYKRRLRQRIHAQMKVMKRARG